MEKIRLGILGCGGMGRSHLAGMSRITDLADITAACDVDPERLENAVQALEEAAGHTVLAFPDYKDMTDSVDAVIVVLPHHLHYEA